MDVRILNPFLIACVEVIRSEVDETIQREHVKVIIGSKMSGRLGCVLRFSGDISGSLLLDLPPNAVELLAVHHQIDPDDLPKLKMPGGPMATIADKISQRAKELLAEKNVHCDLSISQVVATDHSQFVLSDTKTIEVLLRGQVIIRVLISDLTGAYFNNDSILLYGISPLLAEQVIFHFIPLGFLVNSATSFELLKSYVQHRNIDFLIWSSIDGSDVRKDLREIKNLSINKDIRVLVHTQNTFDLMGMMEDGEIFALIQQTDQDDSAFLDKLRASMANFSAKKTEKRSEVRVYLTNPDERPMVEMLLPNMSQKMKGRVKDISVNGIGIELIPSEDNQLLKPNTGLRINTNLYGTYIFADAKITNRHGNKIGVQFDHMPPTSLQHLTRFIAESTAVQMV